MNILSKTFDGLKGLLSGMAMTFRYFVRFDKVITQQYPENRDTLKMPERFRGKIELIKDTQTGQYKCTACGLCVKACPNNSIILEKERNPETKKMRLTKYEYHFERCTLCGLCVEACRFDALKMSQDFETAVYDPQELVMILNDDYRPPEAQQSSQAPAKPEQKPEPDKAAAEPVMK